MTFPNEPFISNYKNTKIYQKNKKIGYQVIPVGNLYVVKFLDNDMYRIQLICKIEYNLLSNENNILI